jgi:hypothetical protein
LALSDIKDSMLSFALYEAIFRKDDALEEDLSRKMVDTYSAFVKLAVYAIKYCKSGGKRKRSFL